MNKEHSQAVAERIIDMLEQGTAPWQKPWAPGELSLPYNPTTGKSYRGINSMWLSMQGYSDPRWMTYKQAGEAGAQVRKGSKGARVEFWKFADELPVTDASGNPVFDSKGVALKRRVELERPRVFYATVFNGEQIDGLPPLERRATAAEPLRHARAELILANSGAKIRHEAGNRAYYQPGTDSITLPERQQFATADGYYATALHELGHWTGHPSRLDRDLAHPFGSAGYAREELRAEIASLMLGERLEIGHDPGQHAAYVGSWIKALKEDHREIFRAASDAERISAFVMEFERERVVEQTADQAISIAAPAIGRDVMAEMEAIHADRVSDDYSPLTSWQWLQQEADDQGLIAKVSLNPARERDEVAANFLVTFTMRSGRPTAIETEIFADGKMFTSVAGERVSDFTSNDLEAQGAALTRAMDMDKMIPIRREIEALKVITGSLGVEGQATDGARDTWTWITDFGAGAGPRVELALATPDEQARAARLGDLAEPVFRAVLVRGDGGVFGGEVIFDRNGTAAIFANGKPVGAGLTSGLDPLFKGLNAIMEDPGHEPPLPASPPASIQSTIGEPKSDGWVHHTSVKSLERIAQTGLQIQEVDDTRYWRSMVEDAGYGLTPVYIAQADAQRGEFTAMVHGPNNVTLGVDASGLVLLADLPTLGHDYGLDMSRDAGGALRVVLASPIARDLFHDLAVDNAIPTADLLNPESAFTKRAIAVTGTAAITTPVAVERLSVAGVSLTPENVSFARAMSDDREFWEPDSLKSFQEGRLPKNSYEAVVERWDEMSFTARELYNLASGKIEELDRFDPELRDDAVSLARRGLAKSRLPQAQFNAALNAAFGAADRSPPPVLHHEPERPSSASVPATNPEPEPGQMTTSRTYLAVPFREKNKAKAAGARWDKDAKQWFAPEGVDLERSGLKQWLPEERTVVSVAEPETPEVAFKKAMELYGLEPEGAPVMNGELQRCRVKGDTGAEKSGAYTGYKDGIIPAGFIQNFKTGQKENWKHQGKLDHLSAEERAKLEREGIERAKERNDKIAAGHDRVSQIATAFYAEAPRATAKNAYCAKKGIAHPGDLGLRVVPTSVSPELAKAGVRIARDPRAAKAMRDKEPDAKVFIAGDLLIPGMDSDGKIWTLQSVNPNFKGFIKGSRKSGVYTIAGMKPEHYAPGMAKNPDAPVIVAEGYATGQRVARLANVPVVIAFDSGNLAVVARELQQQYPGRPILFAADNDHQAPLKLGPDGKPLPNVGLVKATDAAAELGGGVFAPPFAPDQKGTDWDDFARLHGDDAAQKVLQDEMERARVDAVMACERLSSLARDREMDARDDPTTTADDAYIASERAAAHSLMAQAVTGSAEVRAHAREAIVAGGSPNRAAAAAAVRDVAALQNVEREQRGVVLQNSGTHEVEKPPVPAARPGRRGSDQGVSM